MYTHLKQYAVQVQTVGVPDAYWTCGLLHPIHTCLDVPRKARAQMQSGVKCNLANWCAFSLDLLPPLTEA